MKLPTTEKYIERFGQHYILVMMIFTRLFGSIGGLLVIYYVELTLTLPHDIRVHFRAASVVVVVIGCSLTVLLALWETRRLRRVLKQIHEGRPVDPEEGCRAGCEAVLFTGHHHRHEAWLVPCSTLVPVLIYLAFWHNASPGVLINISITVFMGISMALMSTFFAVDHCMRPVIRHLFTHGVSIDYRSLPVGRLWLKLGLCSMLTIMTTALMIGTLARQRAVDIIDDPDHREEAVLSLRTHSTYITLAAVITGVCFATVMAASVTSRVDELLAAMQRVSGGSLSESLMPTGNDEIDMLARKFNSMVERLNSDNRTIRDLNLNLESRVQERTKQLAELSKAQQQLTEYNKQLDAARAGAESANQAKSEFLANISHELRTPLHGVLGMTDLLLTTPLNAQQRKYVQTTRFSGTTLLDLLNEVLELSKIEAGKIEVERVSFDLSSTIERAMELMAHRCREKALELACFVEPAVPTRLIGDPGRLRQVLSNLMSNAIKFTDKGSVIIRVQLASFRERSVTLKIAVEDTGIGIPENRFDRLFRAFSQVDASITRRFGGSGLGLAICKKLCDLMGGQIGFHSKLGHGSTFWFSLPFDVAEPIAAIAHPPFEGPRSMRVPVAEEADPARNTAENFIRTTRKGVRILLVEDNEINQDLATEVLTLAGYHCDVVGDGKQAVAAFKTSRYDLILMDWMMPEMDGMEATRRIREEERKADREGVRPIPIISLTANALKGEHERCLAAGMNDYLSKPFQPLELIEMIETHLARAEQSSAASADEHNPGRPESPSPGRQPQSGGSPADSTPDFSDDDAGGQEPAPQVIDLASLLEHCLGKRALAEKLIAKLHSRLPQDVRQIECALDDDDFDCLASLAHRLKGAAGSVSAERIRRAAAKLEALAQEGNAEAAHSSLAQLKEEADRYLTQAPRDVTGGLVQHEPAAANSCGDIPCAS